MRQIKDLAIRLALKVVSNVISNVNAFLYNPNKDRIIQLLWDVYDVISFMIQ